MSHAHPSRALAPLLLALALSASAGAQGQRPPECVFYLQAAQDMHRSNTTRYADRLEDLAAFTAGWSDHGSCDAVALASAPPTDLDHPGDRLIALEPDGFRAFVWDADGVWEVTTTRITPFAPSASAVPETDPTPPPAEEALGAPDSEAATSEAAPPEPTGAPDLAHPEPAPAEAAPSEASEPAEPAAEPQVAESQVAEPPAPEPPAEAPVSSGDPLRDAYDLLERGAHPQAEAAFAALVGRDVNDLDAHRGLARARYEQGKYHAAATSLELALALDPNDARLHIDLGTLRILAGDPRAGASALEDGLSLAADAEPPLTDAEVLTAHAHLGVAHQLLGAHLVAADHYEAAAARADEAHRDAWQHAAIRARALAGSDPTVIIAALQASQENPSSDMHLLAARVYHDLGDHQSRDQHVAITTELAADDTERARARYAAATYAPERASELYREAADLDPELWQAAYNAGAALLEGGDAFAALGYLERAHQVAPEEAHVRAALARAQLHQHAHEAAFELARSVVDDPTASSELHRHARVTAAHAAHALDQSALVVLHLTAVDGELDAPSLTILGLAYYAARAYPQAAQTLQRAYALDPNDALARNLAQAHLAAEAGDAALALLRELTERHPEDATLHEQLGWAYKAVGDTTQSDLAFRRANGLR